MSLLLKTQSRLIRRRINSAVAATPPSELLSKAALVYVESVDIFLEKLDRYPGTFDDPAIVEAACKALECALTGDLIMAAATAEEAKEREAAAKAAAIENVIPFDFAKPTEPPPPSTEEGA